MRSRRRIQNFKTIQTIVVVYFTKNNKREPHTSAIGKVNRISKSWSKNFREQLTLVPINTVDVEIFYKGWESLTCCCCWWWRKDSSLEMLHSNPPSSCVWIIFLDWPAVWYSAIVICRWQNNNNKKKLLWLQWSTPIEGWYDWNHHPVSLYCICMILLNICAYKIIIIVSELNSCCESHQTKLLLIYFLSFIFFV